MPCYSPLEGWRGRGGVLVFKRSDACGFKQVVPCGQCIGCRLERSRQWAIRIMHEAQCHEENSFLTLTYSDEFLPADGSLVLWHFQDFMKRLRSRLAPRALRFFHCGEYGEECALCGLSRRLCRCYQFSATFGRPHYHVCLFGFSFPDKVFYTETNGQRLFISDFLADVWDRGFCTVGSLSFASAGYVARYCLKKINGALSDDHYWKVSEATGEAVSVSPEYSTMSRRPGIGTTWFDRFGSDVFPQDEVVINGFPSKPPRFYDGLYELDNPEDHARVKRERVLLSRKRSEDSTPARLAVREICKKAQVSFLKRSFENES